MRKFIKKSIAASLAIMMILGLGGCASKSEPSNQTENESTDLNKEQEVTLKIIGCGFFAESGKDGKIDAITGLETPGYKVIVDEWNKVHPNVKLDIEAYPWDNWQASIQTAVLAGGVDVIMHGASLPDVVMPLNEKLEADTEFRESLGSLAVRRTEALGSLKDMYVTGIPMTVGPAIALVNKEILKAHGVDLPDKDWTWQDLIDIAEKCTGENSETKEQNYGVQFLGSKSDNEIWKNFLLLGYGLDAAPTIEYGDTAKESVLNYNDDSAMKVWNYIEQLSKFTSPKDREGIDVSEPYNNHDVAIYFTEAPILYYKQLDAAGVLDKYMVINMPTITEGDNKGKVTPYAGDTNFAICNTSENDEWAWEFIKFCATNDVAVDYFVQNGGIPNYIHGSDPLKAVLNDEWNTAIKQEIADLPDMFTSASSPYTNNISFGSLNSTIGVVVRDIIKGNSSGEEAAKMVQESVDEYMKSVQ